MASNAPAWRQAVDRVDQIAGPILEGVTRHEAFSSGYALLNLGKRAVYSRTERLSRHVLHGLNLPTASDVNRVLAQISAVEHRVRELSNAVEDQAADARGRG